ncbi:unnamed protein product [Cuscuta campestris]|uniref:F-box domain-containing protein n=1 Tax=Cuscuta campestris TaxID=132261 RepID=A0A484LXU6_9ASTE|nr:unnamed protein product [Cuscuta campestris]
MGRPSKRSWEKIPLEVIGDILSRVRIARHVIRASLTCRRWRKAYCKHLHALCFDSADFKFPQGLASVPDIELLITKAIFQTTGLRKLTILMGGNYKFSAGSVHAWLMFVRETLSELCYKVSTSTRVDVLDMFERRKLECLSLSDYRIGRGELNCDRFACLTSLSLCRVGISVEDLNRFLSAPPKLESLKLDSPFLQTSQGFPDHEFFEPEKVVKVYCPTLKALFLDNMQLFQFILEKNSTSIEYMQMKHCYFRLFKVSGSKTLRDLRISHSEAWRLEIEQTDNLESFEIVASHVTRSNLLPMMIQSPKLKRFRFWGFKKCTYDEIILDDGPELVLDLERMAICSPQLTHLAILCDEGVDGLVYRFGGSASLEKVMVLEIGWHGFDGFCEWAEKLLKCCPNVKKVIVHWLIEMYKSDKLNDLNGLSVQFSLMMERDSKRSGERPVEKIPLEVIGDILSRVRIARDGIRASLTCKKWREAYCKHLHALSFGVSSFKFPKGQNSVPDIELLITNMMYEIPGLQKLSILMDFRYKFSAGLVVAWLRGVRETLSELVFNVRTSTPVDVLKIFERRKLESLSLWDYNIGRVEQNFQRFPSLTSLSLSRVGISAENLNQFLYALPNLESLKLDDPFSEASYSEVSSDSEDSSDWEDSSDSDDSSDIDDSSPLKVVKLSCPTLKTLFLDDMKVCQFTMESSSLEYLQMTDCYFSSFKVCGSKTLRDIKISRSESRLLEIEQTDNLESFEFISSRVSESNLLPMMVPSPKLNRFRFWGFTKKYKSRAVGDGIILDKGSGIVLDSERMAICSPQIRHLSIFCNEGLEGLLYKFGGPTSLEKVVVLEIGWDGFKGFGKWAEELLKGCPNVKKVIVHWVIPKKCNRMFLKNLTEQTSSINDMALNRQMQVSFLYDSGFD